jgi:hypothetical protein
MTENKVQSIDPINWIEEAIKEYFNYYDRSILVMLKKLAMDSLANWKKSGQLKSFIVFNDTTAKEIIREIFNFLTFFQSIIFDLNIYFIYLNLFS